MSKRKDKTYKKTVFIGLDLAWSDRNPSGCAVICDQRLIAYTGRLGSNAEIFRFIEKHIPNGHPAIVGIDAPLRVPNDSGSRSCDRDLSADWRRFEAGALPANRKVTGKAIKKAVLDESEVKNKNRKDKNLKVQFEVRGEEIVKLLVERLRFAEAAPIPKRTEDRIVCEVYPHPAHVSLFDLDITLKYKSRSKRSYETRWAEMEKYQQHLRSLYTATPKLKRTKKLLTQTDVRQLRGKELKKYEDILDAITCAYIVYYCWFHGPKRTLVYGSISNGHIIVPFPDKAKIRISK